MRVRPHARVVGTVLIALASASARDRPHGARETNKSPGSSSSSQTIVIHISRVRSPSRRRGRAPYSHNSAHPARTPSGRACHREKAPWLGVGVRGARARL